MNHAIYRKSDIKLDVICAYFTHCSSTGQTYCAINLFIHIQPSALLMPRSVIVRQLHPNMETGQWTDGKNMTSLGLDVQMCPT